MAQLPRDRKAPMGHPVSRRGGVLVCLIIYARMPSASRYFFFVVLQRPRGNPKTLAEAGGSSWHARDGGSNGSGVTACLRRSWTRSIIYGTQVQPRTVIMALYSCFHWSSVFCSTSGGTPLAPYIRARDNLYVRTNGCVVRPKRAFR